MAEIGDEVSIRFGNLFEINGAIKLIKLLGEVNCAVSGHLVVNPEHWELLQGLKPVLIVGGFDDTLVVTKGEEVS